MNKETRLYYHITKPENEKTILRTGIKCDEDGNIFLFENVAVGAKDGIAHVAVSDMIAANQIFLKSFVMFEIDPAGFSCDLIPDDVGEYTARWQWILRQDKIYPRFINKFGQYETDFEAIKRFYAEMDVQDKMQNNNYE